MYEKLPQELKERGAFCLWKYEERDGSRTKVPYQADGLCADSANKPHGQTVAAMVEKRINEIFDEMQEQWLSVAFESVAASISHVQRPAQ